MVLRLGALLLAALTLDLLAPQCCGFVALGSAGSRVGRLGAGAAPLPFSDDVYDAMKDVFSLVALRAKDGFLKRSQMGRLERAVTLIINDAEESLGRPPSQVVPGTQAAPAPAPMSPPMPAAMTMAPPAAPAAPIAPAAPMASPAVPREQDEVQRMDAGYGLAPGTRNTYIIDGMDDMSPTEYRLAMNKKILDEKNKRAAEGGPIGNLAFHDYMRQLQGDDKYDGPMKFDDNKKGK